MKRANIKQDIIYPHPPQRVWAALTESEALAKWLLPNDFAAQIGHHFTFQGEAEEGWSGIIECEVVEVVPLRRLSYTWSAHPGQSEMQVSFTLKAVDGGTHLRLEQREVGRICRKSLSMQDALPSLQHLLEGERPSASRFFRILVDEEALTDALFEFVTDPYASRNTRPVVHELHAFAPEMVSVLETMILDGVQERHDVADYIHFVFGHLSA